MPSHPQPAHTLSATTMRRFILGQQGLYPGRRWRGKSGALAALHAHGSVQIDPVQVIARAHDVIMASRVLDYQPDDLYQIAYQDRAAIDYGGLLYMYPRHVLPHLRVVMENLKHSGYLAPFFRDEAVLCDAVRAAVRERGPLGQRDLTGNAISHYRARKDTGLALQRLWMAGELMTHSRRGSDRLFDFADHIAPGVETATAAEAEDFFTRHVFHEMGLVSASEWSIRYRSITYADMTAAQSLVHLRTYIERGIVTPVAVEGRKSVCYVLTDSLPDLALVAADRVPPTWAPLETTTSEEVTFLAPLEMVSARKRAKVVFGFDYIWEIYTPQPKRKYGYYVLPMLYGDRLVGRVDPKLDRKTGTFGIAGLWLEDGISAHDADFVTALGRGIARLVRFHGATTLILDGVQPVALRRALAKITGKML